MAQLKVSALGATPLTLVNMTAGYAAARASDIQYNPTTDDADKGEDLTSVIVKLKALVAAGGSTGMTTKKVSTIEGLTGVSGVIYLVETASGSGIYSEYVWANDGTTDTFIKIGTTDISLADYVKKTDLSKIEDDDTIIHEILTGVTLSDTEINTNSYLGAKGLQEVYNYIIGWRDRILNRWASAVSFKNETGKEVYEDANGKIIVHSPLITCHRFSGFISDGILQNGEFGPISSDSYLGVNVTNHCFLDITESEFEGNPTNYLIVGHVTGGVLDHVGALYDYMIKHTLLNKISDMEENVSGIVEANTKYTSAISLNGSSTVELTSIPSTPLSIVASAKKLVGTTVKSNYAPTIKVTKTVKTYDMDTNGPTVVNMQNSSEANTVAGTDSSFSYGRTVYTTTAYEGTVARSSVSAQSFLFIPAYIWISTTDQTDKPSDIVGNGVINKPRTIGSILRTFESAESLSANGRAYFVVPKNWIPSGYDVYGANIHSHWDVEEVTGFAGDTTKYKMYRSVEAHVCNVGNCTFTLQGTGTLY